MNYRHIILAVLIVLALIVVPCSATIYVHNDSWSLVAAKSGSETYIYSLTQYDDGTGNAIYGGTAPNGTLLRWGTYTDLLNASFHTAVSYTNPITLSFTDNSTGLPAAWNWSLAGNVSDIRNVSSPFDYGTYLINLTVNRGDLYSTSLQTIALPLSQFKPSGPLTIWFPPGIGFRDASTESPTSWFWDFGDGTNSTKKNPVHYWSPGTYTTCLNASSVYSYSTNCTTVKVY